MSDLQLLDEAILPQSTAKPQLEFTEILETMQTENRIRIHKSIMDRVLDYCSYDCFTSDGEDHYIVQFPFVENEYHYDILLSFGTRCECLTPEHVCKELILRISEIAAIYTD